MIGVEEKATAALPAIGPISELVVGLLSRPVDEVESSTAGEAVASSCAEVEDPLGDDDLQLALYLCFELHYRSFPGVDPAWEWEPGLLSMRAALERAFLSTLEAELGPAEQVRPAEVGEALFASRRRTTASPSRATSRRGRGWRSFASSSSTAPSTS